jgi:hypothetical protein
VAVSGMQSGVVMVTAGAVSIRFHISHLAYFSIALGYFYNVKLFG